MATQRVRMSGPERRAQLLGVARGVFAERGYAGASIEEIAARAGVSKPVVYEHFGSKDGLYTVIVDAEVADLTERITEALGAGSPSAATNRAAAAFLGYIEESEEGFRILVRDGPDGAGRGSFASVIADVAVKTEHLLVREFEARGFDPSTAPMYARMLVGAVAHVGEWWVEVREPPRDVVAGHIVNLLWNGLSRLDRAAPEL